MITLSDLGIDEYCFVGDGELMASIIGNSTMIARVEPSANRVLRTIELDSIKRFYVDEETKEFILEFMESGKTNQIKFGKAGNYDLAVKAANTVNQVYNFLRESVSL